jgi:hypothetical protein
MLSLFWMAFWGGLTALAVAAGVSVHMRRKDLLASNVPMVDDDAVERILATGKLPARDVRAIDLPLLVEDDEPLDPDEIDDEENRFWSESWDEPNEW